MSKLYDYKKERARRQRAATLKRIFLLFGVTALAVGAFLLYQLVVEEGVTVRLSDLRESMGGTGFPTDLPGGVIRVVDNIGDNLAVLNDASLYIFSPKAKIVRNIQKMTAGTVIIPTERRVLAFIPGAKTFAIHSPSRELYPGTMEFGLTGADMNEAGDFAIVTPVKQFASKVFVYNRRFEEIYGWSSPEYVTDVALSPKGDMMAVNCVSAVEGELESRIFLFRFADDSEQAKVTLELPDNLCIALSFPEDDRIEVLTDRQYLILNSIGEKKYAYSFEDAQVTSRDCRGGQTLIMTRDSAENSRLILLDDRLSEKASAEIGGEVTDMALGRDSIYVLTTEGLDVYGLNLKQKAKLEMKGITNIHLIGNRLYYLTSDEIRVLSQSELVGIARKDAGRSALTR